MIRTSADDRSQATRRTSTYTTAKRHNASQTNKSSFSSSNIPSSSARPRSSRFLNPLPPSVAPRNTGCIRDVYLQSIRKRYPNFRPRHDFDILALSDGRFDGLESEIYTWLDSELAIMVDSMGGADEVLAAAEELLGAREHVTGVRILSPPHDVPALIRHWFTAEVQTIARHTSRLRPPHPQ